MRVLLDCRWIFRELSGVGQYTAELAAALIRGGAENEYLLLFDDPEVRRRTLNAIGPPAAARAKSLLVDYGPFDMRAQVSLPALLRREGVEVYHAPNYMIPLAAFPAGRRGRTACVVTLHDVIPLVYPDHAPRARKRRFFRLYRWIMREVGRRADAIICPSGATRADVLRELKIGPERAGSVRVVPEGVDPRFSPGGNGEGWDGPEAVILYVGRRDPYKNLALLVEAFALVRQKVDGVRLRVVGPADARYPEAEERVQALRLGAFVSWDGYLGTDELVEAYRTAAVYVLPSRAEGFGLTVLEAMACGTPVVCTRAGSLPEVAGDAALFVELDDVEALAAGITAVLTDRGLAEDLRRKGLRRAAQFSWERAARETEKVYRAARGEEET